MRLNEKRKRNLVAELSKRGAEMARGLHRLPCDAVAGQLFAMFSSLGMTIRASDAWDEILGGNVLIIPEILSFMAASGLVFDMRTAMALEALFPDKAGFDKARGVIVTLCGAKWLDIPVGRGFSGFEHGKRVFRFPVTISGNVDVLLQAENVGEALSLEGKTPPAWGVVEYDPNVFDHGNGLVFSSDTNDFADMNEDIMDALDLLCYKTGLYSCRSDENKWLQAMFRKEEVGWGMEILGHGDDDVSLFVFRNVPDLVRIEPKPANHDAVVIVLFGGADAKNACVLSCGTAALDVVLGRFYAAGESRRDRAMETRKAADAVERVYGGKILAYIYPEPVPDDSIVVGGPTEARAKAEQLAADLMGTLATVSEIRGKSKNGYEVAVGRFRVLLDTNGFKTAGGGGTLTPLWNGIPVRGVEGYDPFPDWALAIDKVRVEGPVIKYL